MPLSVQLTQQVQEIPRYFLAKHIVIDSAKGPPDRAGTILARFLIPVSASGRTAISVGFCAPTQTLVPLVRKDMRRILASLSRGAQPTATPEVLGEANAPIGGPSTSSIGDHGTVPNWERKPNRLSFVPTQANLGRRVLRRCNGAVQRSAGLHHFGVPPKTGSK